MFKQAVSALRFRALRSLNAYKGNRQYRWTYLERPDATVVAMRFRDGPERELVLRAGSSDLNVVEQVFQSLQYSTAALARDADIRARYEAILRDGKRPLIIDAGANIGMAALYYRDRYPEAVILCVEPEPGNYAEIIRHLGSDPLTMSLKAALSGQDGAVEIVDPGRESWGFQTRQTDSGGVPAWSIPSLIGIATERWPVIPFIAKIDIEGFESGLFDGDCAWIDAFYLMVIELHDWMLPRQRTTAGFLKAVAGRDRDFILRGENVISLSNADPS